MPDILYTALLAANLRHAAAMNAVEQGTSANKPALVAAEVARSKRELATLECSSVPPCGLDGNLEPKRCALRSTDGGRLIPNGAALDLDGAAWVAQSGDVTPYEGRGLILAANGSLAVAAGGGDHAWFDPPRKIRAELCGLQRFGKGEVIGLRFDVLVRPATDTGNLDWTSIAQIAPANVHYADGGAVGASPILALNLKTGKQGDVIQVRGETADTPMRTPILDAARRQKSGPDGLLWSRHFAPMRFLGHSGPLARDAWHHVDIRMVDAHGGTGSIVVKIDGALVVERPSIATGYAYVDDLARIAYAGGPQGNGSYVKFGIYGGRISEDATLPNASISLAYRNVEVDAPNR